MSKYKNLNQVAGILGVSAPDATVEQLVDALIDLGNYKEVHRHADDEYLGIRAYLSKKFLETLLKEANLEEFVPEIEEVLKHANIIIPFVKRQLPEAD